MVTDSELEIEKDVDEIERLYYYIKILIIKRIIR